MLDYTIYSRGPTLLYFFIDLAFIIVYVICIKKEIHCCCVINFQVISRYH